MKLSRSLSSEQQVAACHPAGPAVVMAAPGSGKTRVLTHRIAWLVRYVGVDPSRILALTFTKKAADEMGYRVADLLGGVQTVRCQTMHSWAYRLLKIAQGADSGAHAPDEVRGWNGGLLSGVPQGIAWSRARRKAGGPSDADEIVSGFKNLGHGSGTYQGHEVFPVWEAYERIKSSRGTLDYDDLLLFAFRVLKGELGERTRERFRYILVDEAQDLNVLQWKILYELAPPATVPDLFVVGDVDQSLYEWRGAAPRHFLSFESVWEATAYTLETNYRSLPEILKPAAALIEHNEHRYAKGIAPSRPSNRGGVEVRVRSSDRTEAAGVADEIEGRRPDEVAVLVRCWHLTQHLEEELADRGIPYKVLGGGSFFDRTEVRTALAYLRLAIDPHQDDELREVWNRPTRYLSGEDLGRLEDTAERYGCSLFDALPHVTFRGRESWKGDACLALSRNLATFYRKAAGHHDARRVLAIADSVFGLSSWIEGLEGGEDRLDSFRALIRGAEGDPVEYLLHVEEVQRHAKDTSRDDDAVTISSIHAAKGREWPVVFVIGMVEGVMPHERSDNLEEERRLAYVAMTRAEDELFVSGYWSSGEDNVHEPSRFLVEAGLVETEQAAAAAS